MQIGVYSIVLFVSYLLGSIPTGYLAGRARGVDIRKVGSGNIGATNAFRILGKKAGIFVLLMDAFKGYLACVLAPMLAMTIIPNSPADPTTLGLVAGVAAILGHNYTFWLKFKGGKGIATSAGVLLAGRAAALTTLVAWLIIFLATRYVSLASIAAALTLPFAVGLTNKARS